MSSISRVSAHDVAPLVAQRDPSLLVIGKALVLERCTKPLTKRTKE